MKEVGQVVNLEKGLAKIQIQRHTVCGDCGACQVGQEKLVIETMVENTLSAKIGDQVEIETETTNILKASFILYTFPLILFIIGCTLGYFMANLFSLHELNNYIAFGVGIIFTALSYLIIRKNENRFIKDTAFQPIIHRIIEK